MSFDDLPDEIVMRIFHCLRDDTASLLNLATTCKRICDIAAKKIIEPEWSQSRLFTFNFYLDPSYYRPDLCKEHGLCSELEWRCGTKCELSSTSGEDDNDGHKSNQDPHNEGYEGPFDCYYHRLFCVLNAKYRTFSGIKFRDARLSDRGCINSFRDSMRLNRSMAELKIRALVELELYKCDITLDWLNTILNKLDHISYLGLHEVAFVDPCILVEPKFYASKTLKRLRITGDRSCRLVDSIFKYFLENFPAAELDLTGTRVEYHKRIIQRFYTNCHTVDFPLENPSDYILTYYMILIYLRKYQAIVKHFVANETDITCASLKKILLDEDLKHLKITIKNCPMISVLELARLADQIDVSDLARVTF